MTTPITPTAEQIHILNLLRTTADNLMINALAGTGKTATLKMIEAASPTKPVLVLAFNKKIAEDARKTMASTTVVKTFNSLGHGIWSTTIGRQFKPDARKNSTLYRSAIDAAKPTDRSRMWDIFWAVTEGTARAKSMGYIPKTHALHARSLCTWADVAAALDERPAEYTRTQIETTLLTSIATAYQGNCDFDDQVYMPTLFAGTFPEFPLVMVDEYQDLNPVNHTMIRKLTKHRIIGVGDPHQSIYEFRGAVSSGMAQAVKTFSMTECDLSLSFRCPEAVVRSVRWHVPGFRWKKTGGTVLDLPSLHISEITGDATFICRNNAPLYALAMRCLSAGISVNVSGSEIGPRVIGQMRKLGPDTMSRSVLRAKIAEWLAAKEDRGSKTAADTAACMRVFADAGDNLAQAILFAEHLFKQTTGRLYFTTGHKAKGLEYPHVFHLDPHLLGDNDQDRNLAYVIATRSSDQLYTISSNCIEV